MNLMLLALAFLFLTQGNLFNSSPQKGQAQGFESNPIFSLLGKLNDGKGLDISTILELLSNPAVAGILSSLLGKKKEDAKEESSSAKDAPFDEEKKDTYGAEKDKDKDNEQKEERQLVRRSENAQQVPPTQAPPIQTPPPQEEFFSQKLPVKEIKEENEKHIDIYSREKQEKDEFFAPVAEIATTKVSKELYNIYDNWYTKKK